MNVSLSDIESAIRSNFVMMSNPIKRLQTHTWESQSAETGRLVFVGIASAYGYPMDAICEYLEMQFRDYCGKLTKYKDLLVDGKRKVSEMHEQHLPVHLINDKSSVDQLDYRIYRKTLLINNYLNSVVRSKTIALRAALP